MTQDWKWKIGILHSLGERAFQQLGDKVRRITAIIPQQGGMIFAKSMIGVASGDMNIQHDAPTLVIASADMQEELCAELDRAWNGSVILPVNGQPRLKLT